MNINIHDINLNFNPYIADKNIPVSKKIALINTIKTECLSCQINKPYSKVRDSEDSKSFKITAQFGDKEEVILSGSSKDFHPALLEEVTSKFFYNLNASFEITPDMFDFIRRLPNEEWKVLAKKIDECPPLTQDQIDAFRFGKFEHPVFKLFDWPALALKAFFLDEIDKDSISKLLLFDACTKTSSNFKIQQIIDENGNVNEDVFLKNPISYLNEEAKKRFIASLKLIRPDETQFFLFKQFHPEYFIINKNPEDKDRAIFPPALINLFLHAKSPNYAIKLKPVLGYSLRDDFTHKTKRDMFVPCRYVQGPEEIHGNNVKEDPLFVYEHDIEHGILESENPDRAMWLELAAHFEIKNLNQALNWILDRVIDTYGENKEISREVQLSKAFEYVIKKLNNSKKFEKEAIPIVINFALQKLDDKFLHYVLDHGDYEIKKIFMEQLFDSNKINILIRSAQSYDDSNIFFKENAYRQIANFLLKRLPKEEVITLLKPVKGQYNYFEHVLKLNQGTLDLQENQIRKLVKKEKYEEVITLFETKIWNASHTSEWSPSILAEQLLILIENDSAEKYFPQVEDRNTPDELKEMVIQDLKDKIEEGYFD